MKSNLKFFKKSKKLPIDKFFMNVLYDNKFGYYASNQPFGLKGDFTTAPKISILFSEIIAIWIISVWEKLDKPEKFNIIELGPGDGSLTKVLLKTYYLQLFEFRGLHLVLIHSSCAYILLLY